MGTEITMESLKNKKLSETQASANESIQALAQGAENESRELTVEQQKQVRELIDKIDVTDTQSVIQYGVGAQRNISDFSEQILAQVRTKDSGEVGTLMADLSTKVKEVGVDRLGGNFLDKIPILSGASRSIKKFWKRYETVEVQIDQIESELDRQRMGMLKDIQIFDTLYDKNLEYFKSLEIYIAAGEQKLAELRNEVIPRLKKEAVESGDSMNAQLVRDFEDSVERFDKKVHDLKLSKTIAIQTAPQIRLVQNNDRMLVDKIQTVILNTIPLWKSQIVIAIGLHNQEGVLKTQREITDTTNQLLVKNAEALKQSTVDVARESERGIVDIETLKQVNESLITTIDETIKIHEDGRARRRAAETELAQIEERLKNRLIATK